MKHHYKCLLSFLSYQHPISDEFAFALSMYNRIDLGYAQSLLNTDRSAAKEYIYSNGWSELRDVQLEAARVIFDTDANLLISSSTASGKTEAAFFPILTDIANDPEAARSVSVLYIAPLKSLINDQFYRLEELIESSGIALTHWHGDVGAGHKSNLLKNPSGILQITPESLESLLICHGTKIRNIFKNQENYTIFGK